MEYEGFKKEIYSLTGIDLNAYKERQMKRRIEALIERHKLLGFQEFIKAIKTDKELYEAFLSYLTINVSEFYRNPEQWVILEKEIIPRLKKNSNHIKIWSAACSTGDEPYSLVMLFNKYFSSSQFEIKATDIDKQILEKAKMGIYHSKSVAGLPMEYQVKYFRLLGEHSLKISDDIKKQVTFQQHNLLKDTYENGFDLIVCRNVMIYFTEEAKKEIYEKFYKALKPGGFLFVGSTEQMLQANKIGFSSYRSFFYQKK